MRRRSLARWLAPLALVTCAVAIYAVVHSELTTSKDKTTPTSTRSATAGAATTTKRSTSGTRVAKVYVVKSGDVLSAIAQRTGVTVADLERFNPTVDAAALHPGQRLKLSR